MNQLTKVVVVGVELALVFSDGVECFIPLRAVRSACPCAACQGEPDAMGRVIRPQREVGAKGWELVRLETVGGYALQLFWGDGHSSGIYSFDYLRRLGAAHCS